VLTTSHKFQVIITKVTLKAATGAAAAVWRAGVARCTSPARSEIWRWFSCCWITEHWWTPLTTSWNDLFIWLFAVGRRCAPHSGKLLNYSVKTAPTSTSSARRCFLVTFRNSLVIHKSLFSFQLVIWPQDVGSSTQFSATLATTTTRYRPQSPTRCRLSFELLLLNELSLSGTKQPFKAILNFLRLPDSSIFL